MGALPRLLIAGLSGDSGKTVVAMGLSLALRRAGIEVRAFKKGPDYIDSAWLSWGSGSAARNLDTWMMGLEVARASFVRGGTGNGINIVEGNRGLYDGVDAAGTHSSAALAKALGAPVVLVVDAAKMTRTAAALVLGCQHLDPQVKIAAVVLNNVNGRRHERLLRESIESACGVPVLGVLARGDSNPLPARHLGLVPPGEHDRTGELEQALLQLVENRLDVEKLVAIARNTPPLDCAGDEPPLPDARGLTIGYLCDAAFSFYYPENLEQLQRAGATLISISPLEATALPENLHALYIGGGFPETHAGRLAGNTRFLASLRAAWGKNLPIYAECGGLMLLARSLVWKGKRYGMAHVFPFDVELCAKPQGHGYSELRVQAPNPFFAAGTILRGHEFHYSRLAGADSAPAACAVLRGVGCGSDRDFLVSRNTMAGYTHLHALATPEWARGVVAAAGKYAGRSGRAELIESQYRLV